MGQSPERPSGVRGFQFVLATRLSSSGPFDTTLWQRLGTVATLTFEISGEAIPGLFKAVEMTQ